MKPTTLLCVCADHITILLNEVPNGCRCNHYQGYHQKDELMGRNEDGTWKTAKAKTYPSDMCRLLARPLHPAVDQRWGKHPSSGERTLQEDYNDFFIPLDPYYDFQRSTDCMHHRRRPPRRE